MVSLRELERRIENPAEYRALFGGETAAITGKQALARSALELFRRSFPHNAGTPVWACFVPGRVELLGKHTDYAGGHSLLAAVDRGFFCIMAKNGSDRLRLAEANPEFASCEIPILSDLKPALGHWSNYPMTMVKRLAANFPDVFLQPSGGRRGQGAGINAAFGSDLPVAGGLSGSSALMIVTFFALALPNALFQNERFRCNVGDKLDLAMYLACVENGQTYRELHGGAGVGTFGGSEDHTQILNAKAGYLSLYQFCPTRHQRDILFPEDLELVLAHSGMRAEKTGAAREHFNLASRRAKLVVQAYNEYHGTNHQLLRDLVLENQGQEVRLLENVRRAVSDRPAQLDLVGRVIQFFREDSECLPSACDALAERDYGRLGEVIDASHALSRTHLRNILPEIDYLQKCARELGAIAASGFGAGFGGSVYALIRKETVPGFIETWRSRYSAVFPAPSAVADFFTSGISGAAGEMFQGALA